MRSIFIKNNPIYLDDFSPEKFTPEEVSRLKKLVSWDYDNVKKQYQLTRRFPHKVGRVVVKNIVYVVTPDMSSHDFTVFFLYSLGIRLERFTTNFASSLATAYGNSHPDFRTLAATLLVLIAEDIAGSSLAKGYVRKRENLPTVRGRIDWREMNRPGYRVAIPCVFSEMSVDNLLNRVVGAGLRAVQNVPIHPMFQSRLSEQVFTWNSIAAYQHIKLSDLQLAEKSINRLTEKYRSIIGLCRMVMFGYGPDDFFGSGETDFQCLEFDLAMIFERFALRLIQERLTGSTISVEAQVRERDGLRNGNGQTYHETRPDFLIKRHGVPLAVIDAKYKPRYVSQEDSGFKKTNKVSEADVYQLLFYAQRASQLAGGAKVPAFIVCPRIDQSLVLPPQPLRKINWMHDGRTEASIEVIDIDFLATINAIKSGTPMPDDGLATVCKALVQQNLLFLH